MTLSSSASAALVHVAAQKELTTGDEQVAVLLVESLMLTSSTADADFAAAVVAHAAVDLQPCRCLLDLVEDDCDGVAGRQGFPLTPSAAIVVA